jgi:hypothetical protein
MPKPKVATKSVEEIEEIQNRVREPAADPTPLTA